MNQDTICAVSTAPGAGGIAVIRVSGPEAITICNTIFVPRTAGKDLLSQKAYTLRYGSIRRGEELIDDVLIALFRAPHSFTGEDTIEITCHGSVYIQQQIMQLLIENGCRSALPGEYTQRAFMNGKMDLSQAEAVADLIASTSAGQHRLALNQMRGGFSNELKNLREQLLHITSLMELELDFSDHEELEFADRSELSALAAHIETVISHLANSFSVGNAIKNGIPVAIIGETNAGKSTLLNVLLNEEKAIVSDIHGTTRDVIEDTINIQGITFRFIDTAGIRETHDAIESIGIERTFQKLDQANIVLWMIDAADASQQIAQLSEKILPRCEGKQLILVFNKADLLADTSGLIPADLPENIQTIFISAKQKENINELQDLLIQAAHIPSLSQNDIIVTNIRHYEALTHALDSIHRVQEGLSSNLSGDFVSQDLRECIFHLSDIVGEVTTDQVLGNIFERFCIGK
ncbi:tRNA uridine-5-carboxymethylaminomethyl(34) synthesis GTPase MnmE [Parabacteroides acidifaciens]|uniref:tRNA modification GTPase MnmE n=1 Tax=Parabacteroides acidifaciens TaxID=2290935 RepID=A0ABR7P2D5_9BACT|nr:tRNA uridine-5-carboxymethylaminomethyl(34) synthesis GTPase MnmE [Parabacteroides acidifaciens]MBC8602530.1 tRNA uridine-5-carboxymethylaminomethyl(34) synthesis GTPase MnmE [Parabacteroides acidifaciens]